MKNIMLSFDGSNGNLEWGQGIEVVILLMGLLLLLPGEVDGQLSVNFYQNTACSNLEAVIQTVMVAKFQQASTSPAAILRLFFHDCMVNGCDASVLIASTPGNVAERDAPINLSLAGDGFDAVTQAKTALEKICPGIVSCADILAIATRDLVRMVGGPAYPVLKGRRDSRISRAIDATEQLPTVNLTINQLNALFGSKGFSQHEMVTLSGGHTIGFVHCDQFLNRIYNFSSTSQTDPTMSATFAQQLRLSCSPNVSNSDPNVVVFLDQTTSNRFDNAYYMNTVQGEGVLTTDQELFTDLRTRSQVVEYIKSNSLFVSDYVNVIIKLGSLEVLTGTQGEIRRALDCSAVN
ncbi:unnamed protein product [Sphagnum troendelagicum]|uniref:Peroxidase n=1 Tax=Sphagnum troendelagicum TaxID=128251 RepID=A0ABP0TPV6_9BRYO